MWLGGDQGGGYGSFTKMKNRRGEGGEAIIRDSIKGLALLYNYCSPP